MSNKLRAGREKGSVLWRNITIPKDVAQAVATFLSTGVYPSSYSSPEDERAWERIKAAVAAAPVHVRMSLPAVTWPQCVTANILGRAQDIVELYRVRTPSERATLIASLNITTLPDSRLFDFTTHESRTGTLRPLAEHAPPPKALPGEKDAKSRRRGKQ